MPKLFFAFSFCVCVWFFCCLFLMKGIIFVLILASLAVGFASLRAYNFNGNPLAWFKGAPMASLSTNLEGSTVLVTGGNTGIGKETVTALLGMGADVLVGCRSLERCQAAFSQGGIEAGAKAIAAKRGSSARVGKFRPEKLDLGSFSSIKAFAGRLAADGTVLNVLVDNAAVLSVSSEQTLTEDGLGLIMGTNHYGVYLLTRLLVPALEGGAKRNGTPSRIVVVSSEAHRSGGAFDLEDIDRRVHSDSVMEQIHVYSQSKLANIFFARELSRRFQAQNVPITVNSNHPGFIRTDLTRNVEGGVFRFLIEVFLTLTALNSWEGAQNTIYLASSPDVAPLTGHYFVHFNRTPVELGPYPDLIQKLLWDHSAQVTGLPLGF